MNRRRENVILSRLLFAAVVTGIVAVMDWLGLWSLP